VAEEIMLLGVLLPPLKNITIDFHPEKEISIQSL
jgi:hypothetical protein